MGYAVYEDPWHFGRWAGYAVPAECDMAGCTTMVERGMGYQCEVIVDYQYFKDGVQVSDAEDWDEERDVESEGCYLYFCSEHEPHEVHQGTDPKPDHPKWLWWILNEDSWELWRQGNPEKVAEYQEATRGSDGRGATKIRSQCRACASAAARERRRARMEDDPASERAKKQRASEVLRKLRLEDNDAWLRRSLRASAKSLGLDPQEVLSRFDLVGNTCEACGHEPSRDESRVHIDHSHVTGKFRGFLCGPCNVFLGYLEAYEERIPKLLDYRDRRNS